MRGVALAVILAGLVAVAAAPAARLPIRVSLTASPSGVVTTGQTVRLIARAPLPAGGRLVIAAGRAPVAECRSSPCMGSYSAPSPGSVGFVASVRRGDAALGRSRTITVRWTERQDPSGHYQGRTSQNEHLAFDLTPDRKATRLEIGNLNESCIYPDGNRVSRIGGGLGPIAGVYPVAVDGSFEIQLTGPTVVGSVASVYHITIFGRVRSGTAVGTIRDDVTAPTEPKLSCTTGDQSWVAVKS